MLETQGNAYTQIGEHEKALALHESALKIRRQLGNSRWVSDSLQNLGELYCNLADFRLAQDYFTQKVDPVAAGDPAAGSGQWSDELARLTNSSTVLIECANYDEARRQLEQALKLMRRGREWRWEDVQRSMLGDVDRALGNYDVAEEAYSAALELARNMNSRSKVCRNLICLGALHRLRDDLQGAMKFLKEALEVATDCEHASRQIRCGNEVAMVHLLTGHWDDACRVIGEALRKQVPRHYHRALLLSGLASARADDRAGARARFEQTQQATAALLDTAPAFLAARVSRVIALAAQCVLAPDSGFQRGTLEEWRRVREAAVPGVRKEMAQLRGILEPVDSTGLLQQFAI